jgi:hypothetical protein
MNDAILTGVFTLGGVIVGGLLNGGMTLWIERVRDRREARAAARLIRDELLSNKAGIEMALKHDWPYRWAESEMWHELRPVLARNPNARAWQKVALAYLAVANAQRQGDPTAQASSIDLDLTRMAQREVDKALDALDRIGELPTSKRGWLRRRDSSSSPTPTS